MRILITGCEGPAGQALGRQLASTQHTVIGVDMQLSRSSIFDSTTLIPAAVDPAMLPALRRLLKEHQIDVLIPTVSDELPHVALAASSLLTHASVVIGNASAVRVAHDKYLTMAKLSSQSVPVPRFGLPSDFSSTKNALDYFSGPIIVKPRVGRGGRGVIVVDKPTDADWSLFDDSQIVQEFAPGVEYAPMVYQPASESTAQTLVAVVEKTGLKEGRVGNATHVNRIPVSAASDVATTALHAIEALGLTGPADLDIRRRVDGTPVVLEVNARFGANSESAPELLNAVLREHAPMGMNEVN